MSVSRRVSRPATTCEAGLKGPRLRTRADVVKSDDAGWIWRGGRQLELLTHAIGEDSLAAAEHQRIDQQVQFVHEVVLEQRVHELTAAIEKDVLARLRLQRAHLVHDVVADDGRVAPDRLLERPRDDVLLRRVHHVAERIALWHRLE